MRNPSTLLLLWSPMTLAFVTPNHRKQRLNRIWSVSNKRIESLTTMERENDELPRQNNAPRRYIASSEKNPRLPVWPVANGVLLWLLGRLSLKLSAHLENVITGRVCPMPLNAAASPFILLVHHVHSFAPWDPIRWFQRQFILPEGFPSHPHRGFVTLTFILDGGFVHRDSLGQKQVYGSKQTHHSQWLYTGAGVLHEEMFLHDESWWSPTRQELFQLWINCPRAKKYNAPFSILLGGDTNDNDANADARHTPTVTNDKSKTLVLAGCYQGACSGAPLDSNLLVLHVKMEPHATWECSANMETAMLYMRLGSVQCGEDKIETQYLTQFDGRRQASVVLQTGDEAADFLFLAGDPLMEPVAQQGSFVLNNDNEVNQAYADYQAGYFGRPWDHSLTDDEWQKHVEQYPCVYKPK